VEQKEIFVENGHAVSVMGAGTKDMRESENALVIGPNPQWGSAIFADLPLEDEKFHIHARLTLDTISGSGASFLLGGFYHFPCSPPEGNQTFRVSLDDDMETYERDTMQTDARILCGMTNNRARWCEADKEIVGRTRNVIKAGRPFDIDIYHDANATRFYIDGNEIFRTDLRSEDKISGAGDGGWPVCFGFMPDHNVIRLHELSAEGTFAESSCEHTDVWQMGHDGYFTYRIPSMCVTTSGLILAFAEARRSDFRRIRNWNKKWNPDEVHCVMKRSTDNGRTWSQQKHILGEGNSYEVRDPAPVADRETGDLFLITRGPYIMKSEDDGQSWSEPRSLRHLVPESWSTFSAGPANSGIQLQHGAHAGRLMYAVASIGDVGVMYSDDHGATWELGGLVEGRGGVEPELAELVDGRVVVNARNQSDNAGRLISVSDDDGESFESHYDDQLPSQWCAASFVQYRPPAKDSHAPTQPVVFCGPAEGRRQLTIMLSSDGCQSWQGDRPIYSGHSAYSAMAILPDGHVGILYEKDAYRRLSFVKLNVSEE
jgi:sialidase-1